MRTMTRDQAIEALRECRRCGRWITVPTCDHCWVDNHRCPPTLQQALAALKRAIELGDEAALVKAKLSKALDGSN